MTLRHSTPFLMKQPPTKKGVLFDMFFSFSALVLELEISQPREFLVIHKIYCIYLDLPKGAEMVPKGCQSTMFLRFNWHPLEGASFFKVIVF